LRDRPQTAGFRTERDRVGRGDADAVRTLSTDRLRRPDSHEQAPTPGLPRTGSDARTPTNRLRRREELVDRTDPAERAPDRTVSNLLRARERY
jgi:hypothetical protein